MADRRTDDQILSDDTTNTSNVAALQAENASLQDRLLRSLAEAENVRRRADRAAQDAKDFAVAALSRELLVVVDDLRRAIAAVEDPSIDGAATAPLIGGVQAIERSLVNTLERFGLRRIEARGRPFDPHRHEAILEISDPHRPPGRVADVLEEGYTLHDRLLRPAKVSVTRGGPPDTGEPAAREDGQQAPAP